jgi:RNA polymerase sigma-70 factor, ECF subfamily
MSGPSERVLPVSLFWPREEARPAAEAEEAPSEPASAPPADEQLMESLKARDREALAELFRRYSRLAFSIGFGILRDAGEAEEIVQDVFVFLYERAGLFDRNKGSARAWLVQVAYHRALDRREYLGRRNFYLGTDAGLLADTLAGPADLDRDLASKENRDRLKEAFTSLSERQRRTLELYFFEDLDFDEIAERLGEARDNVRHYYYRGIQKLRKDTFVLKLRDGQP